LLSASARGGVARLDQVTRQLVGVLATNLGHAHAKAITLREYELYACLQFLARANSRRFDSADQVRYVVADREQAEYIQRKWDLPDHLVLPLPMADAVKADLDDVASKGRGRQAAKTDDDRREYQRQKKADQRVAKPANLEAEAVRKRAAIIT
jgi:hypothetical protein